MGSGTVVTFGLLITLAVLLFGGHAVGWDATWRSFGVTPLQPHFFDMHVILDYAACAAEGLDAYLPHSCNEDNFNIPPIWLWVGYLGLNGSDSVWLAAAMIAAALAVMVGLFKNRSAADGALGLFAIVSPSVMMGVERGNLDLLILALVGGAALLYREKGLGRIRAAFAVLAAAIVVKLFPMFCIALAARRTRRAWLFAAAIGVFSLAYLAVIFPYIILIRQNVPTTFILSYGYKAIFLGFDHMRAEARLAPIELAGTWLPLATAVIALLAAAAAALMSFRDGRILAPVGEAVSGTAFLFGSGIYCGTFLLGTNFIYRLMFLLLCVPQLQDWRSQKSGSEQRSAAVERGLFVAVLSVLWLNGNANGHTSFLLLPQIADWLLFFGLAAVLMSNFLNAAILEKTSRQTKSE
jgi:hypothetical protein